MDIIKFELFIAVKEISPVKYESLAKDNRK